MRWASEPKDASLIPGRGGSAHVKGPRVVEIHYGAPHSPGVASAHVPSQILFSDFTENGLVAVVPTYEMGTFQRKCLIEPTDVDRIVQRGRVAALPTYLTRYFIIAR